jgi:E3 ubiquitin-protein ligase HERC2
LVEGFGKVHVRRVCAAESEASAIGEDGELFSWGRGWSWRLSHGDKKSQPLPKRVEALRGVRVSSVSGGDAHAVALAEDGLVYSWGDNFLGAPLGIPHVESVALPTPVEALRGVRVSSIAVSGWRNYAVADTGELWAWGLCGASPPLGHDDELEDCPVFKPIESLRGIKVDAVAAGDGHTLAMADDGSVYAWGNSRSRIWHAWPGAFSHE